MCVLIFYTVCMWLNRESVSGLILSVYPRQQCILMPKKEKKKCISSACTFPHPISVCVLFVYACLLSLCAQSAVRGNTPTSLSYQPRSSRLAGADQKHGSPIGQQRKRQQFVAVAKILLLGSRLLLGDMWCIMDGWFPHAGVKLKGWWLALPSRCIVFSPSLFIILCLHRAVILSLLFWNKFWLTVRAWLKYMGTGFTLLVSTFNGTNTKERERPKWGFKCRHNKWILLKSTKTGKRQRSKQGSKKYKENIRRQTAK